MLDDRHFDFERLATSSSDDDEIVTDELAVVRGDRTRACRVEDQRASLRMYCGEASGEVGEQGGRLE